jgi:hypothetical protein
VLRGLFGSLEVLRLCGLEKGALFCPFFHVQEKQGIRESVKIFNFLREL